MTGRDTYANICAMRERVKVRTVAGSVVVSLPRPLLAAAGIEVGDQVVAEAVPPKRIVLTKESEPMGVSQRLELEVDLLEKKRAALESDLNYKLRQYNDSMPTDPGMADDSVARLIMDGIVRDRDQLDVEIAEKRLQLLDVLGSGPR